jgi:pimeloyl-ACP methyl ester carboxylesterase
LLLHGGTSQTSHWDYTVLPSVEDDFHVYAYDRAGHGYTADQIESYHFEYQVREAIAYLEDVVKEPAHLIGWSDGGIIALMIAIQRPELVRSIVAIGANYHFSGVTQIFDSWTISDEDREEYAITSPDAPETLDAKIEKMHKIWKSEPDISVEDLKTIQCPVLVLAGDDDVIKHSHTIELYETIPLGQLAIIPGTSHMVPKEKPTLMNAMISQFLEDLSYPITKAPIRRTSNQPE